VSHRRTESFTPYDGPELSSPPVPNIAPWLSVRDAQQAVGFYAAAFGATELYRLDGDAGRIEIAQLSIGGATFWVQHDPDPGPAANASSPAANASSPAANASSPAVHASSPEAHASSPAAHASSLEVSARSRVRLILSVDDPDAIFAQSVSAGATPVAEVHEEYGWRTGRITDPFGHDWELSKQLPA